jgi:hypothetical protein
MKIIGEVTNMTAPFGFTETQSKISFYLNIFPFSFWPVAYREGLNSQFSGKYIRNNLIRIRVPLIYKLSGTPD